MFEITEFLQQVGQYSLDLFWFPLFIWTACAALIQILLNRMQSRDPHYHYYFRVALVASLPFGIMAAGLAGIVSKLTTTAAGTGTNLIVIRNPLSVTTGSGSNAAIINWGDPYLWIGIITLIILAVGLLKLCQMGWNYLHISRYAGKLQAAILDDSILVQRESLNLSSSTIDKTFIAFAEEAEVPFTFGWRRPIIVIPSGLRENKDKLRMAVCHELMHIKRGDFIINGFVMAMKSLLWFHPLLHVLYHETKDYREISCDSEVLSDESISRKKYAELLFELAPKKETYARQIVSMSVNQSTLQKRINTMKTLTKNNRPFTKSLILSLVLLVGISGFIACSDLQDNGITNSEIQQAQKNLQGMEDGNGPLFVIREDTDLDGSFDTEEIATKEQREKISLIKSKYIQSMEVFKGEHVPEKYASQATNGVAIINLLNKEKAFSDLKNPEDLNKENSPPGPFFVVVEQMPKLKGGLAELQQCIEYPEMARKAGIEGRVIVQFIVNEQGAVEYPQVIQGIGGGADEEAIRCVEQAEFEPGKQRGKPVRVQYSLPVVYKLPGSVSEDNASAYLEMPKLEGREMALESFINNIEEGTISGVLIDRETDNPIVGANIVVNETTIGTSTNNDGEFTLKGIPAGNQQISISHVKYDMVTLNIRELN